MKGALLVVERRAGPLYHAKCRDSTGRRSSACSVRPGWCGRARRGVRAAVARAAMLSTSGPRTLRWPRIAQHEDELRADKRTIREGTFADAVERWMHDLEFVQGVKPSTLADYRYLLAPAGAVARRRGSAPAARIMRAFAHRPLFEVTSAEVGRYLASLDADPAIGPRTVNKHAMGEDTFELPLNPARRTDKRREPDPKPIDFYEPEEVLALVRAARAGLHRDPSRPQPHAPAWSATR